MPRTPVPPSQDRRLRVVVAEDNPLLRTAIAALLDAADGLDVVGVAADAAEAVDLAVEHRPDVCVVDVGMPEGGGPHAAREISRLCAGTQVLALSGHDDRATVVAMLRAGASGYLVKGTTPEQLVRAVRDAGRGQRTLSPEVTDSVVGELTEHLAREDAEEARRSEARDRIEQVLAEDRLSIVLQPIVELESREAVAFEALARFATEPVRSPSAWFAEAATMGRLLELEIAAVALALKRFDELPGRTQLSVNVSPATAASDAFFAALPRGASCERLIVEVTEHAPVEDYDALAPAIDRLRRRGVKLAIDDAGAGFASLRHILRLAPDIIKTDMTLTRGIETARAERALTRALIAFATETGATIVAEGIQTETELDTLADLGVVYGQGFHLGRPQVRPAALSASRGPARDALGGDHRRARG